MPLLSDLYNVRVVIEENSRNSLLASGAFAKVFTRLNGVVDLQKDRPRLELKAFIGAQNRHRALCLDGNERNDQWAFTMQIAAITAPENDPDANTLHDLFCGQVRATCSTLAQSTWNDLVNWPNHAISEALIETGTQSDLKTAEGYEVSIITVAGVVAIRKAAFDAVFTN